MADANAVDAVDAVDAKPISRIDNAATLEYLTNPVYYHIMVKNNKQKSEEKCAEYKADVRFYKKRIISLFKDMVKDAAVPIKDLKIQHDGYIQSLINYFKMVDHKDIIQEQYLKEEEEEEEEGPHLIDLAEHTAEYEINNDKLFRKTVTVSNLDNYVIITTPEEGLVSDTRIIPLKMEIDLHRADLKMKGVRAKKLKNKINI